MLRILVIAWSVFLLSPLAMAQEDNSELDLVLGYNFIFSNPDEDSYRSHSDVSAGYLVDRFHFAMTQPQGTGWFDRFTADASLANRVDASKVVRFSLGRTSVYSASVTYSFLYDFFHDARYNYGYDNRNLERDNFGFDFNWFGARDLVFNFGYGCSRTRGGQFSPYTNYDQIFQIPMERRNTREEFRGGLTYNRGGFTAGFQQAWLHLLDESGTQTAVNPPLSVPPGQTITAGGLSRDGLTAAHVPVTTANLAYTRGGWSTQWSFNLQSGSMDNQVLDLKNFYFTDDASRTEMLLKAAGRADIPERSTLFRVSRQLDSKASLEYTFFWKNIRTETSLDTIEEYRIIPQDAPPAEYSVPYRTGFLFRNTLQTHTVAVAVRPARGWRLGASYKRTGGEMDHVMNMDSLEMMNIRESYHRDRLEFKARGRLAGDMEVSGLVAEEWIEHPLYRDAGDRRREFAAGVTQPVGDRFAWQVSFRDQRVTDDAIRLDHHTWLLDMNFQYMPREWVDLGAGFTRFDVNYAIDLLYHVDGILQTVFEMEDTAQNCPYAYVTFNGDHRIRGSASVHYLDDAGQSFPLTRWNGRATIEVTLGKSLSALLTAAYFSYREEWAADHDYDFNQLTLALRWTRR